MHSTDALHTVLETSILEAFSNPVAAVWQVVEQGEGGQITVAFDEHEATVRRLPKAWRGISPAEVRRQACPVARVSASAVAWIIEF